MACVTRFFLRWRHWLNPSPPWLRRLRLRPRSPWFAHLPAMEHGWRMRWRPQRCCSLPCALAAMLANVATGSSVIGGFYHYAKLLLHDVTGHVSSAVLLATLVTGVSIWIAYRDVKISARLMLWIEATSVTVIVIVVALLLVRHGWDWCSRYLVSLGSRARPHWDRRRATRCRRFHARSSKAPFSPELSLSSVPM